MAMTKCKECGTDISSKADACPKCGAKRKKTSPIGCLLGIIVLIIIIAGIISSLKSTTNSSGTSSPAASQRPPPAPTGPKLLLLNWSWREEHGYAIVEGEVQNISSENIRNVQAVATFYTADKKFITSDDALIQYNPILPGQTSPFKTMATHNPSMETANITFKELMGGTIPWKKKE